MSERLHPGLHPDPDSLNAFIEGALPEHERLQCLAHLAECPRCREVVFFAQETLTPATVSESTSVWRRRFTPRPLLAAAAAVCVAVVTIWLYRHSAKPPSVTLALVSKQPPHTQTQPSAPRTSGEPAVLEPAPTMRLSNVAAARPASRQASPSARGAVSTVIPSGTSLSLVAPPSSATASSALLTAQISPPPPPALQAASPEPPRAETAGIRKEQGARDISGISGTVTDRTGVAISGATIRLRQLDGTMTANAHTDASGQFDVASLPAGRYELQIGALGFRATARQIDLQPREVASANSELENASAARIVDARAASAIRTPTPAGRAGISGTVTDPTGAAISGATIKIRQLGGTITTDARTDTTGQFHVAALAAGQYELRIGALGFRQATKQVDLRPQEVASVKAQLEIGAVTETVEVTAAASTVQTATASFKSSRKNALPEEPRPLPSQLPAISTVTSGKNMLAVDNAGGVYFSGNSGKDWKSVKPVWPGKVGLIGPVDPPQSSNAIFQLTTDSGSIWLSRDGTHWRPAAQH